MVGDIVVLIGDITENIFHIAWLISQEFDKLRNISEGVGGFQVP
jgi:hypothetical protein